MNPQILQRVELLFQQSRFKEAKEMLETELANQPDYFPYRINYIIALMHSDEEEKAEQLCDVLMQDYPEETELISLSAEIDLRLDRFDRADSKVKLIKELGELDEDIFILESRAKLGLRNYDKALEAVNKALEIDASNQDALNLKIMISNILGKDIEADVNDVLELNPENAWSIANHAEELLNQGKVKEALERAKDSLMIDPENPIGQHVMAEALKSRFFIYRLFRKYSEFTARLSEGGSWYFLIGVYVAYKVLRGIAKQIPELIFLVYIIIGLFLLTWIIGPITNLYLSFNRYGKLLLDHDEKLMARLVGLSLLAGIICTVLFFTGVNFINVNTLILTFGMAIPFGSFLQPRKKRGRQTALIFTCGLLFFGILSLIPSATPFFAIFILGLFAYQWVINGILIRENSRVID